MKIKSEHFEHLKQKIEEVLKKYPGLKKEYENGDFPRADKVKDLQKRFCFDLLFGAGLTQFVCKEIYAYANDDHIYTALRKICPTVKRAY